MCFTFAPYPNPQYIAAISAGCLGGAPHQGESL